MTTSGIGLLMLRTDLTNMIDERMLTFSVIFSSIAVSCSVVQLTVREHESGEVFFAYQDSDDSNGSKQTNVIVELV